MKLLNLIQGSPEWHAHRATHNNASEAPAVMGVSKYMTRAELLRLKAGGEAAEVSSFQQGLFDRGHETEAQARAIYEREHGIEFFPACGESEEHPKLAASYDGLDIDEEVGFEHKLWNEELAAAVRAGEIPASHYWQLEHQLLVNPRLKKIIFMVSDGTTEKRESLEYTAVRGRAKKLLAAWEQFDKDLAEYIPEVQQAAPVATPVASLPVINYRLNGLTLSSNLPEYREAADALVERSKLPMETDQDFADREQLCKSFDEAEKRIDVICDQVLGEIHDISNFTRGLRDIQALFRAARLAGEKLVTAEKNARKQAIKDAGLKAVSEHMAGLAERIGHRVQMVRIAGDFDGVIKGKKSLSSMKDAVDAEVARVKLEANEVADAITANLKALDEFAPAHAFLFNDLQQIVCKAHDDFVLLVKSRVGAHQQAEEARLEAERERIRREEQEKLEREQKASSATTSAPEAEPAAPAPAQATVQSQAASTSQGPAMASNVTSIATRRPPTDEEIIRALSQHFNVSEAKVIARLRSMDFDAIEKRMAVPF